MLELSVSSTLGSKNQFDEGLSLSLCFPLRHQIKSNWNARANGLTGRPVLSTYITGEIIACYPTWHCQCIYMTRVWNWAPECLYMPPTGLFAQTAGKREKQECVCAHKMSFVKSFKMKNSSRKRSDRQAKSGEKERERTWKIFRWTGHLRDAALIVTGSMLLHRRGKGEPGKGLESMGSQRHNTKKIFSLCVFICFSFLVGK